MNIVIIGTGNAAQVLGRLIVRSGHRVLEVAGRDVAKAAAVAEPLGAHAAQGFGKLDPDADLYLLALADRAIPQVAARLRVRGGILAHTAGSVPMSALGTPGRPHGVVYPLQSLRVNIDRLPEIPFLVDGSDGATRDALLAFASSLSARAQVADDEDRLRMHLAAVFSSNFMNHLFALTERYCAMEGLDFSMLRPLIEETVQRLPEAAASDLQTGPAVRGDRATQRMHLGLLEGHRDMESIYRLMSRSIRRFHQVLKEGGPPKLTANH
jgi:predicted short-subunit dehydrogenase-like oxidoreductase (DUF2520 family)